MKRKFNLLSLLSLNCLLILTVYSQTTSFTYQGRLTDSSVPANGTYNMSFALFGTPTGGSAIATENEPSVTVTNGIFTVELDFATGPFAGGSDLYLQITVNGTPLSTRQKITSAPYAIRSRDAGSLDGLDSFQFLRSDMSGTLTGNLFLDGISNGNGAATIPAYRFSSDSNTGMFLSSADTLAFSTGGTTRLMLSNTSAAFSVNATFSGNITSNNGSLSLNNGSNTISAAELNLLDNRSTLSAIVPYVFTVPVFGTVAGNTTYYSNNPTYPQTITLTNISCRALTADSTGITTFFTLTDGAQNIFCNMFGNSNSCSGSGGITLSTSETISLSVNAGGGNPANATCTIEGTTMSMLQ